MTWIKVNLEGYHDYELKNRDFNEKLITHVKNIFHSDKIGVEGYYSEYEVGKNNTTHLFNEKGGDTRIRFIENSVESSPVDLDLTSIFKTDYEFLIASNLVFGNYDTYVIGGTVGSGKSSLINNLINRISSSDFSENISIIKIDFDRLGFDDHSSNEVKRVFKEFLVRKLKEEVRHHLKMNSSTNEFLEYIELSNSEYQEYFGDFKAKHSRKKSKWNKNPIREDRADLIINYINKLSRNDSKIECLMLMMRFLKIKNQSIISSLVIFDNIDRIPPRAQYEILNTVLSINQIADSKFLVTMRPSTFTKFLSVRNSLTFGYIPHDGPNPIQIIRNRLHFWLNNGDDDPSWNYFKTLKKEYQDSLLLRFQDLLDHLNDPKSRVTKVLSEISGLSVRLGLEVMYRFFINPFVPFNESNEKERNLIRSLLIGSTVIHQKPDDEKYMMPRKDIRICNVFCLDSSRKFTLMNLRIMQVVRAYTSDSSLRKAYKVHSLLARIKSWSGKELEDHEYDELFLNSINYLIRDTRPLLGVEHKFNIKDIDELFENNDVLRFTEIGNGYFNSLINDINYLQEAFLSVEWCHNHVPPAILDNFEERFKLVRLSLLELIIEDQRQLAEFNLSFKIEKSQPDFRVEIISNKICYNVARSVFAIFRSTKTVSSNEVYNWKDLLLRCLEYEPTNRKIENLVDQFEKLEESV